ncbi:MAG: hypothetical protein AAGA37_05455 [Actinomycetota bacterium]
MYRPAVPGRWWPPLTTDDRDPWELPPSGDPWDPSARATPGWSPVHADHARHLVTAAVTTFVTFQTVLFLGLVASQGEDRFGGPAGVLAVLSAAFLYGTRRRLLTPSERYVPVIALLGVIAGMLAVMLSWF